MHNGLTPSFPFQIDTDDSDYILIKKTEDLVRQNLTNLLLTSPGERMMDPDFGAGIRRFLFENTTNTLTSTIRSIINAQVKKYMPFISVDQVSFSTSEQNSNFLGITISYTIIPSRTTDLLRLNFDLVSSGLIRS